MLGLVVYTVVTVFKADVIMNKKDYLEKPQGMIDKEIDDGIYKLTSDTILCDMKKFNDFF